jgi:DNA-directed RNA polymerase specialized sigma24 family protein
LEQLTDRDGATVDYAVQVVEATGGDVTARMREEVASARGGRMRPRLVDLEAAMNVPGPCAHHDARVLCGEARMAAARSKTALACAFRRLGPTDRRLLRLRFGAGLSVAQMSRALSVAQKPLYRKIDRLLALMRMELERAGVSADDLM